MLEVKDAPEIITCKFTHIESLTLPAFQKLFNHKSAHSPQPMTVMTRFWWPFAILVWVFHGILLAFRVRLIRLPWVPLSAWCFNTKPPRPSVLRNLLESPMAHERRFIWGFPKKWWVKPQIIYFNRVFHYKPSILGYPYFWKHPYGGFRENGGFPQQPCVFLLKKTIIFGVWDGGTTI